MSETTYNLIQAMANGDALETEQAFGAAMAEKLAVKLDDMRAGVAQNMFNAQEPVVEEETLAESEEDHASKFTKEVLKKHKHLTSYKDPDDEGHHWIQHKKDEDGSYLGAMKVHHKDGKIHVEHHGSASEGEPGKSSGSSEEMHKHVSGLVKSQFPKHFEE
jgi:hypothetical protein